MFNHITIGSNDLDGAKRFYDAILGAMGAAPGSFDAKGRLNYAHDGGRLMITKPLNGEPATGANGGTIGFKLASPEQVDAWHAAGIENGGKAIEDPPGPRAGGALYLAYLADPAGNKLCALHRLALA
jgi:catechol 2,3-dioxygenase-like lactoylglutathione lyase family enzyme